MQATQQPSANHEKKTGIKKAKEMLGGKDSESPYYEEEEEEKDNVAPGFGNDTQPTVNDYNPT